MCDGYIYDWFINIIYSAQIMWVATASTLHKLKSDKLTNTDTPA